MVFYFISACTAGGVLLLLSRKNPHILLPFGVMTFLLPFAVGGFHSYTAALAALFLLAALWQRRRNSGRFQIHKNLTTVSLAAVLGALSLSPLWAADRGMTILGLLHWLPVLLYWLYLGQCSDEEHQHALDYLPLSGCLMTLVCLILIQIPELFPLLTVNGRLTGFFQYSNTYAAFLLAGYILSTGREKQDTKTFLFMSVLAWGILLSGSRIAFVLLCAAAFVSLLRQKSRIHTGMVVFSLFLAILLGHAASLLGLIPQATRYQEISDGGTFYARLLYWQDALPLIFKNPLGLGYMGWRTLQGSVQTGRYYTAYLHNGFLQLMVDAGWLPALLMAVSLLQGLRQQKDPVKRMLLFFILAYCMLDFHTEYFVIWVILLSCIPYSGGPQIVIRKKFLPVLVSSLAAVLCLWLGLSEAMYYSGNVDTSLSLTHFHTDALEARLSRADPAEQPALADQLLSLDPNRSRGWNAKAYDAQAKRDWTNMMNFKEKSIALNRYQTEQYMDYIRCLYVAMQSCLAAGDEDAAWICAEKILDVEKMIHSVNTATSALAIATGDENEVILPDAYADLIAQIKAVNESR